MGKHGPVSSKLNAMARKCVPVFFREVVARCVSDADMPTAPAKAMLESVVGRVPPMTLAERMYASALHKGRAMGIKEERARRAKEDR